MTTAPEEPEESLGLLRVRLVPDSARQVALCHHDPRYKPQALPLQGTSGHKTNCDKGTEGDIA